MESLRSKADRTAQPIEVVAREYLAHTNLAPVGAFEIRVFGDARAEREAGYRVLDEERRANQAAERVRADAEWRAIEAKEESDED